MIDHTEQPARSLGSGLAATFCLVAVVALVLLGCRSRPSVTESDEHDPEDGGPREAQFEDGAGNDGEPPPTIDDMSRPVDETREGASGEQEPGADGPDEQPPGEPFAQGPDAALDESVEIDPSSPLLPSLTADEEIALLFRAETLMDGLEWPQGMYPLRLREPDPPVEGDDVMVDVWRMIGRAQFEHRMFEHEQAIENLQFAFDNLEANHPDRKLVAFNLGAAWQQIEGEEAQRKAIEAYRRVLALDSSNAEIEWINEPFRHFAAAVLSQLMIERGDHRRAVSYGYAAAFLHRMRDPTTGEPVSRREATDVLLPAIYDYAGLDIREESSEALPVLLTTRRPEMRGRSSEDLLANVLASGIEYLAQRPTEEAGTPWPRLYRRSALRTFYERWLNHFPEHERRDEIISLASDAVLTHDD